MDVAAVAQYRDRLPDAWVAPVERADRLVDAVSLSDLDRLTVQAAGRSDLSRVAASAVLSGSFHAPEVSRELRERYGGLRRAGHEHGFALYRYAPDFLADLSRFRAPDQSAPPDASLGLGVRADTLVAGGAIATDVRGIKAVRATLDARADAAPGLLDASADARALAEALVGTDVAVGVALPFGATAERALPDQPAMRRVLSQLRTVGAGTVFGADADRTRLVLAYEEGERPELSDLRAVFRKASDRGGIEGGVQSVGVREGGRVVVATMRTRLGGLWDDYREVWTEYREGD